MYICITSSFYTLIEIIHACVAFLCACARDFSQNPPLCLFPDGSDTVFIPMSVLTQGTSKHAWFPSNACVCRQAGIWNHEHMVAISLQSNPEEGNPRWILHPPLQKNA